AHPHAHRARRAHGPDRGAGARRGRLPAQAFRAARAARPPEGPAAPRVARRGRGRHPSLRPPGDRPRGPPGPARRQALRSHELSVRPAGRDGAQPRARAVARPHHGCAQGARAGSVRSLHRRARLAHPRGHRGRSEGAPTHPDRARRRLRLRQEAGRRRLSPRAHIGMKTLYLRIYLTVVAVLALFAVGAGWYAQRHIEVERASIQGQAAERVAAWATLLENSLPPADAPAEEQSAALIEWSSRLRIPLALDDARGTRLATSPSFARREAEGGPRRVVRVTLSDGRGLWVMGPGRFMRGGPPPEAGALHPDAERGMPPARGEEGPASRMVMRERTQGLGLPPWMLEIGRA